MRTTIALDADVATEVERLRRNRSAGVSEIVNELIRRGMAAPARAAEFVQTSSPMSARIDISNIAEVLETIDGPATR